MAKDQCPSCYEQKDVRAIECKKCQFVSRHPRKGTGAEFRIGKHGYVNTQVDNKEVYAHRHAMEIALGRKLLPTEHVHHKNGIKTDNRVENLEIISASDHARLHFLSRAKEMSKKGHAARWGWKAHDL